MKELFLLKLGEIVLKGQNRRVFEDKLKTVTRRRMAKFGEFKVNIVQSTLYVEPLTDDCDLDGAWEACGTIFGVAQMCRCRACEKNLDAMFTAVCEYLGDELSAAKSFKVESKRSDKRFPLNSIQISQEIGGRLAEEFPNVLVDVHNPDYTVNIEVRETAAYVHGPSVPGAGGLPTGTGGRAAVLLSGGIDSPVAGYMIAKRGVEIECIHFFSYPYTSELRRRHADGKYGHFGTRLSASDADALAVRPGCGWGDSTLYREGSNANCLDIFPLEWSGCGRGDYRESPMELLQNGAPISTEFHYTGCEALKSAHPSALPASRGQTVLAVYLEDSAAKLRLTLLYGVLPTVFIRRAILENCGDTPRSAIVFCMTARNSSLRCIMRSESTQVIWLTPKSWSAMWKSLKSVNSSASAGLSSEMDAEKMVLPSSSSEMLAMRAMRSAMRRSTAVDVGDLNMTVSATMAAAIRPASFAGGMRPRS